MPPATHLTFHTTQRIAGDIFGWGPIQTSLKEHIKILRDFTMIWRSNYGWKIGGAEIFKNTKTSNFAEKIGWGPPYQRGECVLLLQTWISRRFERFIVVTVKGWFLRFSARWLNPPLISKTAVIGLWDSRDWNYNRASSACSWLVTTVTKAITIITILVCEVQTFIHGGLEVNNVQSATFRGVSSPLVQ